MHDNERRNPRQTEQEIEANLEGQKHLLGRLLADKIKQ